MNKEAAAISPVMQALSAYIASALDKAPPPDVIEKGKHHLIDTLAAMVSGSRHVPGQKAIAFIQTLGGIKECTVVGTRILTSSVHAALANGMMAHADETDDSHVPAQAHPGCGVVPAALAIAERDQRNGEALLRAVILGYDICARANFSLRPKALRAAGHSSMSFGPLFGAASAAGALSRLNLDQVRYLLSYTVQQAAGVDCWARDKEHIEKAFDFGGMTARNGVTAANMAASGFTGVEDVFSGEKNFFKTYSADPDPEAFIRGLGSTYEIMNTNIKRWSVGSPIQAALDSLSALIEAHKLRADDVVHLSVTIHQTGAVTVNDRTIPDISMQHLLAVMLLDGTVTFESSHDEARMHDPRVLQLKRRIQLHGSEELERAPTRQAILEVVTQDGRVLKHHTTAVRGTAANPMERKEVDRKAYDLMAPILGKVRAHKLVDRVWNIQQLADARELRPLLRA